jgi:small-conductance mechanosensitive channel
MEDLLNNYSLSEILTFLVIFCLAIKGFFTFWDWAIERLRKTFNKETQQETKLAAMQEQINQCNNNFLKVEKEQAAVEDKLSDMLQKINLLIESDRDDIKSYITKEHHAFCYDKGWIDDYSLNCIERRYNHYVDEGGNSFIKDLMEEIRELPKQPPQ